MLIWMSGPREAVEQDAYTNGPAPWHLFTPDAGDVIVAKNIRGYPVIVEDYKGNSLPDLLKKLSGNRKPA